MNILIIQPRISYYNGGGERFPMDVIENTASNSKKHNFFIFTTKNKPYSERYKNFKKNSKKIKNIFIIELAVPRKIRFIYNIKPGEKRFRWDVESFSFANQVASYLLKKKIKISICWVFYIMDFPFIFFNFPIILYLLGYPTNKVEYREALLLQFSKIVSLNKNIIEKWNQVLNIPIKNYSVLQQPTTKSIDSSQDFFSKDDIFFNILFVGRIIERKGILDLCEVVSNLYKKNKNIKLFIVGEGPQKNIILNYIFRNKLSEVIFLLGHKENIFNFYKEASVCVFPSHHGEGQMSTVLEAMMFNGNVISTSGNGNEEYIKNNYSGFLFKPKDIITLQKILTKQINKDFDIKKIKNNAAKMVRNNSWGKFSKKFLTLSKEKLF